MSPDNYTEEQIKDIREREAKALAFLAELQLTPAVLMTMKNIGDDAFCIKPMPYLNDLKYKSIPSPIQDTNEPI